MESLLSGLALLEILSGFGKAVILDAILTGDCPPGEIH